MNAVPDTDADRWEVTAASHNLISSYYFVVHPPSKTAVRVSISNRNRRHYIFDDPDCAKEEVPDAERRKIDRALVRYLTAKSKSKLI